VFYNSHDFIKNLTGNTKPVLRYDGKSDLKKWQAAAREKLYELLGLPFAECDDLFKIKNICKKNTHKQIDFIFQSEKDYFVQGSLCVPNDAKEPLPVVICLLGHATGMHIGMGIAKYQGDQELIDSGRDFVRQAISQGYCAAIIEWRYMGEAGRYEADGGPLCARKNAALPALLLGRSAIGERVWDVKRLMDVIEKNFREYVDTERIICMGHSGGGTACFYTSCIDERIKLSMPSGSFCSFDASIIPLHHCCCNYIPGIRKYFDMGDLAMLIAPRIFLPVCGINDRDFPIDGVKKSFNEVKQVYEAIGKGDICRLVEGNGGHQFYPDDAWPIANSLQGKYITEV